MNRADLRAAALLALVAGLLASCAPPAATPLPTRVYAPQPDADFALVLRYGSCLGETVDTFQGTFTRDMCPPDSPVTVSFVLTAEDLRAIYREMAEIDLLGYPDQFSVVVPEGAEVGIVTPSTSYYLKVRNGQMEKELHWTDDIVSPTTPEADRLRTFLRRVIGIIYAHPELKQVPQPDCGCA